MIFSQRSKTEKGKAQKPPVKPRDSRKRSPLENRSLHYPKRLAENFQSCQIQLKKVKRKLRETRREMQAVVERLRETQEEKQRPLAELESIYDLAPVGLCVFDRQFRYIRINERMAEINGIPAARHVGRTPREIVPDLADQAESIFQKIIETGKPVLDVEINGMTPAQPGVLRTWIERWLPLQDAEGLVVSINVVALEITRRKRAEREILELNEKLHRRTLELEAANRELEAFTASVAHDLRTPLIVMGSYSQRLLKRYAARLDARGKEFLEQLLASTRKMDQIIDELLRLSYVTRTELAYEWVNLSALARSVGEELRRMEPNRQVEWSMAEDLIAKGDPRLLRITMENLIRNAWKFSRTRPRSKIEMGAIQSGHRPIYFIRDNGCGFDMAQAEKIFHPFNRLHKPEEFEGTGIGLATVKRIIDRHGGRIWAESEVGQGTTFYFTI